MVSTHRVRCVYDGHRTLVPDISVCVRVVSRGSVGEFLTWAKISGVDLPITDIKRAYVQASISGEQK